MSRCRCFWLASFAVLAALLPAVAGGQSLTAGGALGGGFNRSDSGASSFDTTASGWDFAGQLRLTGSPVASDLLHLDATGAYGMNQTTTELSRTDVRNWSYQVNATAFASTPVVLSGSAGQGWTRSAVTTGAVPGETFSRNLGGSAAVGLPGAPRISANASRVLTTTYRPGAPDVDAQFTNVDGRLTDAFDKLRYALDYRTTWSDGSLVQTNFRNHALNLNASAVPDPDVQVHVAESYFVRVPTVESPLNPRVDANNFTAGVTLYPGARLGGTLSYGYSHSLTSAADVAEQETQLQSVGGLANYRMNERWLGQFGASASHAIIRVDAAETTSDSQNLIGTATWRRATGARSSLYSKLSANVGAVEPATGPLQAALGGSADVGTSGVLGRADGSLSYGITYQRNGASLDGTVLEHRATAGLTTSFGLVGLRASVQGNMSRRDDALVGSSAARSITVNGEAGYKHLSASVSASASDGLASISGLSGVDGIILGAPYDTHTRFVTARLVYAFGSTQAALDWQTNRTLTPGAAWQSDSSLQLTLAHQVGQFTISIEDRYWIIDSGPAQSRINTFFVRAVRSFQFL